MSFKREVLPKNVYSGDQLTARLVGCGFKFAAASVSNANIEDTLFACSIAGMGGDLRALSLLVDWLGIHSGQVLADRLYALGKSSSDSRVRAFWAAIAKWKKTDARFRRFLKLHRHKRIDLLPSGTDFHVRRRGEDPRFETSPLRVPADVGLRKRPSDVMTPGELAEIHRAYYYRLIIGPTYRADMWAELDLHPDLIPAELARRTYGSFATAWEVKQQWSIIKKVAA